MSLDIVVVCDRCGQIMAGVPIKTPRAGQRARRDARESPGRARTDLPGGHDYCGECWSNMRSEPWPTADQPITENGERP